VRLLYLSHNCRSGGTYYRAMPMAERMALRGHEVTLLTVSREQRLRARWSCANGVRLGELPDLGQSYSGEGYGPLDSLLRMVHALGRRYDIIHRLDHKPNATFGGFAGRLRGARLVADWADGDGFAPAISHLLDDAALREELGRNARRIAETAFSWPKLTEELQDFYALVLR